jgi:hypothetical protein
MVVLCESGHIDLPNDAALHDLVMKAATWEANPSNLSINVNNNNNNNNNKSPATLNLNNKKI